MSSWKTDGAMSASDVGRALLTLTVMALLTATLLQRPAAAVTATLHVANEGTKITTEIAAPDGYTNVSTVFTTYRSDVVAERLIVPDSDLVRLVVTDPSQDIVTDKTVTSTSLDVDNNNNGVGDGTNVISVGIAEVVTIFLTGQYSSPIVGSVDSIQIIGSDGTTDLTQTELAVLDRYSGDHVRGVDPWLRVIRNISGPDIQLHSVIYQTSVPDTVSVEVRSEIEPVPIIVDLLETDLSSGRFEGWVRVINPVQQSSTSSLAPGDKSARIRTIAGPVVAMYMDAQGTQREAFVAVDTLAPDLGIDAPFHESITQDQRPEFLGSFTDNGAGSDVSSVRILIDSSDDPANGSDVVDSFGVVSPFAKDLPIATNGAVDGDLTMSFSARPVNDLPRPGLPVQQNIVDFVATANDLAGNVGFSDSDPADSTSIGPGSIVGGNQVHEVTIDHVSFGFDKTFGASFLTNAPGGGLTDILLRFSDPLNVASIDPTDFVVRLADGSSTVPRSIVVEGDMIVRIGLFVEMAPLDPVLVKLIDSISDLAGNVRTADSVEINGSIGSVFVANEQSRTTTEIPAPDDYSSVQHVFSTYVPEDPSERIIATEADLAKVVVIDPGRNILEPVITVPPDIRVDNNVTGPGDDSNLLTIPIGQTVVIFLNGKSGTPITGPDGTIRIMSGGVDLLANGTLIIVTRFDGDGTSDPILRVQRNIGSGDVVIDSIDYETSGPDAAEVTVTSDLDTVGVTVQLLETNRSTGRFEGFVRLAGDSPDAQSKSSNTPGDQSAAITVTAGPLAVAYQNSEGEQWGTFLGIDVTPPEPTIQSPALFSATQNRRPTFAATFTDNISGLVVSSARVLIDGADDPDNVVSVVSPFGTVSPSAVELSFPTAGAADGDLVFTGAEAPAQNLPNPSVFVPDHFVDFVATAIDMAGNIGFSDADPNDPISVGFDTIAGGNQIHVVHIDQFIPSFDVAPGSHLTGKRFDHSRWMEVLSRNSIRLTFSEPLDGFSLQVTDFQVTLDDGSIHTPVSLALVDERVYLQLVNDIPSDDTPRVAITGPIADRAGNITAAGDVEISDGIPPTVIVMVSGGSGSGVGDESPDRLTNDGMTITIVSDEQLTASPQVAVHRQGDNQPEVDIIALAAGINTFEATYSHPGGAPDSPRAVIVTAIDINGNVATSGGIDDHVFTLDVTIPDPVFRLNPESAPGSSFTPSHTPLITLDYEESGEQHTVSLLDVTIDDLQVAGDFAPHENGLSHFFRPAADLATGPHRLVIKASGAQDAAGNAHESEVVFDFEVDPPVLSLPILPADPGILFEVDMDPAEATVVFNDTLLLEALPRDITGVELGQGLGAGEVSVSWTILQGLSTIDPQTGLFTAAAVEETAIVQATVIQPNEFDPASTRSGIATVRVVEDLNPLPPPDEAPKIVIVSATGELTGVPVTFSAIVDDPNPGDGVNVEWDFEYDGANFVADSSGINFRFASHTFTTAGLHMVAARATDGGGLSSGVATFDVTLLNPLPQIIVEDPTSLVRPGISLDFQEPVLVEQVLLDGSDVTADVVLVASARYFYFPVSDLALGPHTVTAAARRVSDSTPVNLQQAFEVVEQEGFVFDLVPGWNLISFPGHPADPDINFVFPGQVDHVIEPRRNMDPASGLCTPWESDLSQCPSATQDPVSGFLTPEPGSGLVTVRAVQAYWVHLDGDVAIQASTLLFSDVQFSRVFVTNGFSAVGPNSFWGLDAAARSHMLADDAFHGTNWVRALGWDANSATAFEILPHTGATVQAGRGYYLEVASQGFMHFVAQPGVNPSAPAGQVSNVAGDMFDFDIEMDVGWSYISLPGDPLDPDVNVVFTDLFVDAVLEFDPTAPGLFKVAVRDFISGLLEPATEHGLVQVGAGPGLMVHSVAPTVLSLTLQRSAFGNPLVEGWNFVGPIADSISSSHLHASVDNVLSDDWDWIEELIPGIPQSGSPSASDAFGHGKDPVGPDDPGVGLAYGRAYWVLVNSIPPPLAACRADADESGRIERSEALIAVTSYLLGGSEWSRQDAIEVVTAFFLETEISC